MLILASLCLAALAAGSARADDPHVFEADDATVAKTCPGLVAWVGKHQPAVDLAPEPDRDSPAEPDLRAQLLGMVKEDQQIRGELFGPGKPLLTDNSDGMQKLKAVDDKNLATLYKVVADYGVPTRAAVGLDGLKAFWLLIQHAQDTRLQKRVLDAFNTADSGVPLDEIALLDDRINSNEGRPQKYGSQFHSEGKDMVMSPVEDEAHLDERREKMGLPPIADYRCMLQLMYGGSAR